MANDCLTCGTANCTGAGNGSGVSQNCCDDASNVRCFPQPLTRTGSAAAPAPAWPDTTYPKTAAETLASAFCAPGAPGIPGIIVNADMGLPGPAAFVLPVDAVWNLDPTPTTVSTTTLVGASTTTTTIAPACTTAADCNDNDACTDDACTAGTCASTPKTGAAAVSCQLADLTDQPACTPLDPTLQTALAPLIIKAQTALDSSLTAPTPKKAKKLRSQAKKALKKALKKVNKATKKGTIPAECQSQLAAAINALVAQIAGIS